MPEPRFTLDEIAHFDRCLFPADLEKGLIAGGFDELMAKHLAYEYRMREPKPSVVRLYQDNIGWTEYTDALNAMLTVFFAK